MGCRVLPGRAITVAKIYRSQGLFTDAQSRLESCLTTLLPHDSNRCPVLCSLADVYCDLHLPNKANKLIIPEIEEEKQKIVKTKSLRRLLVALIDINIQRGLYDDALTVVEELQDTFRGLSDLDVSDQLLHCASLSLQLEFVITIHSFIQVQAYKSFEGEGFTKAVIHLSMSLAYLESGDTGEAPNAFDRAKKITSRGLRDFWIPTLTAWSQHLASRIQVLTGWDLGELYLKSSLP